MVFIVASRKKSLTLPLNLVTNQPTIFRGNLWESRLTICVFQRELVRDLKLNLDIQNEVRVWTVWRIIRDLNVTVKLSSSSGRVCAELYCRVGKLQLFSFITRIHEKLIHLSSIFSRVFTIGCNESPISSSTTFGGHGDSVRVLTSIYKEFREFAKFQSFQVGLCRSFFRIKRSYFKQ